MGISWGGLGCESSHDENSSEVVKEEDDVVVKDDNWEEGMSS